MLHLISEEKSETVEKSKSKKKHKKDHVEKQKNPFKSKSVTQIQEQLYNTDADPQHNCRLQIFITVVSLIFEGIKFRGFNLLLQTVSCCFDFVDFEFQF